MGNREKEGRAMAMCRKLGFRNGFGFGFGFGMRRGGNGFRVHMRLFLAAFFISCLAVPAIHFASNQVRIMWYKSEVVGGSLRPRTKTFWKKLVQAPQVFHCTYSSCPGSKRNERKIPEADDPKKKSKKENRTAEICPDYFKWIREDLAPWEEAGGITLGAIEAGRKLASFRIVIVKERLYVEPYTPCYQTRALFTIWGLLQLIRYYPRMVPDVDLVFNCDDVPVIEKGPHKNPNEEKQKQPPILLRYCSSPDFFDIPFPDWSFWGWPEIDTRPWEYELADIIRGSHEVPWEERQNAAYWKGNPYVAPLRMDLLKCNSSEFNAQIYIQDWIAEETSNFTKSKLAGQCKHRYKIYAEGWGWSVSLKYILACNSPALLITPKYYDFFTRGLRPQISYWPIRRSQLCESIKFSVDWGSAHPAKAQEIGQGGQSFISEEVKMHHVYDYMLHMLWEYARLQRFEPSVPPKAEEVCTQSVICLAEAVDKPFLEQSRVDTSSEFLPCTLPQPSSLQDSLLEKAKRVREVEEQEDRTWNLAITSSPQPSL